MRLKRVLHSLVALFTVGATMVLSQSAAHASPLAIGEVYGPYILVYMGTNSATSPQLCLDNPNSNASDNTRMEIYTCVYNARNQKWYNETAVTSSDFWTYNGASGKCLTVKGASTADLAPIIQYGCNTGTNERWKYDRFGNGVIDGLVIDGHTYNNGLTYRIRALNSGLCIRPVNSGSTSKTLLEQSSCANYDNLWAQFPA